jgi:trimethylamine--corrinoid protein Co-methyltransferase
MSKPRIGFLSDSEIEAIHDASLQVLEKTGIKVMSKVALDILKKAGAKVDYGANHATIPGALVEEALKKVPKTITYGARNPKNDFVLDKRTTHFTTTGMPAFVLDGETGERRNSLTADLACFTRIADYLKNVHSVWPMVVTTDVPGPLQCLTEFVTVARNTAKHLEHEALNVWDAQYQIEIATAIVGSKEQLRKKPIISAVQCVFSPLTYEKGLMEGAIEYARAGVPVVVMPMPLAGTTGPVTPVGTMALNNAEFLGDLVILELASPGAPVLYSPGVGVSNFKTGYRSWAPEDGLMHLGLTQLAHHYGLPSEVGVMPGDSKLLDAQAGYQKAISIIAALLMTPDIALGLGGLGGCMSAETLIIDNEIIDYALRYILGLEIDDEGLAVDIIDKVGPGGHFLGEKHTLQHFREGWVPEISDMDTFEVWQKNGSKAIARVAKEKTKEILATHKVEPLPEDVEKEITHILKRSAEELR